MAVKTGKGRGRKATTRGRSRRRKVVPEDLLRFRFVADPQVSPDGEAIVFVRKHVGDKNEYVSNLWLVDLDDDGSWGTPRQFTSSGKDSRPRWSPDGTRIAFLSGRDKPKPQVFTIPASGGEATALTSLPEGSVGAIRWSPDGAMIAASFREQDPQWTEQAKKDREAKGLSDPPRVLDHWWYRLDGDGYFNAQRYHLYVIDAETGEHRRVYSRDTLGFFTFDFSPDSKQLVIGTNRSRRAGLGPWVDELLRLNISTGKLTAIRNLPPGPKDAVRWSPNGRWIAYAGHEGEDSIYTTENVGLWVCDPVKGKARCLTRREDYCLMGIAATDTAEMEFAPNLQWSPDSRRLFVQMGWHGEAHLASIRPSGGRLQFHTGGARLHTCGNISADGATMAMCVGSPTQLDEVHAASLDEDQATLERLTDFNAAFLKEVELSKPKSHWTTASDGNRVHVWVMPATGSASGRARPAVLEIHGGPHAQYGLGFFFEFQVLAAAGYTVVFSNPRGSKGYGRDFCSAIRGSWGGADWTDIEAVAEFMKAHPGISAKRMGVMGGSYGGYMTNWAIGHTNAFKAAITDRCVSNLVSMFGNSDFIDAPDLYWEGNAWDRPEARWDQSPLKHIGNARTPTLIIHSEGDLRCNIEQAEQVFSALTVRNVPTRFVRYPRITSHGMSRSGPPDMRIHRLHQILDWWKRYL